MVNPQVREGEIKMKYYSEKLNRPFDTEEECVEAEKEFDRQQEQIQKELDKAIAEKKAKEEEYNASKKELAKVIEAADKKIEEAQSMLDVATTKAREIINEAKQKANEILNAAKSKKAAAQQEKYDAIAAFNKKYGPYTISLTGDKAAEAYNRDIQDLSKVLQNFWSSFWDF